jgi:hypothetical protein
MNAKSSGSADAAATGAAVVGGETAAEISRAELLGAVNGLLARAGVPMDMEQQVRYVFSLPAMRITITDLFIYSDTVSFVSLCM